MFCKFAGEMLNNPFEYVPDEACDAAFRNLLADIEVLKSSRRPDAAEFCAELDAGKMLGVLIARDNSGQPHTLYAFSGQAGEGEFYFPGFVDPVFNYLEPDGYFKRREAGISDLSREIKLFENGKLAEVRKSFDARKQDMEERTDRFRKHCRESKEKRAEMRKSGSLSEETEREMLRESQFEKAELSRLKKRLKGELQPYSDALEEALTQLSSMKERRRRESEELQRWLSDNFILLNARGESRSLSDIFASTPMRVPPSGAGECCAPKLLQAAFLRGWHPERIAEYWYGRPRDGEVRIAGQYYPACRGKCLPVLRWMLQGQPTYPPLDSREMEPPASDLVVIYENRWFCVVEKPAGMLSVPGKGAAVSAEEILKEKYGADRCVKVAHRLDQDTSGLLIATFGDMAYREMQRLFARRDVRKTYVALLDGDHEPAGSPIIGRIELPLSPDWLDRPRQRVDTENGKEAVTEYEFVSAEGGLSRVFFHPLTGRTHQLRVHAASSSGLGMPIAGDRLYGRGKSSGAGRLMLHAHKIEFVFPADGVHYVFESPVPF